MTNGEFREVECTVLLAACGALAFGGGGLGPGLRRVYAGIVCASIAGSLCLGATRMRVYAIGPGQFFAWHDESGKMESGALRHMRVSQPMLEVMREVRLSVAKDRGPFYFGPRMEWNYTVQGLPSSPGLPAWWHPGTAFGRADEPRLLEVWRSRQFGTLIFLKGDYTYYSDDFLRILHTEYSEDDRSPAITIYRRRH